MRYAILADIHSEPDLLEAVLAEARDLGAQKILCVGDTTGYGPEPNETLEMLRENVDHYVLGNHDMASLGLLDYHHWSPRAHAWHRENEDVLEEHLRDWLREQPLEETVDGIIQLVHGTPSAPEDFHYLSYANDRDREFEALGPEIAMCFVGHSHLSELYWRATGGSREVHKRTFYDEATVDLAQYPVDSRFIVCAGSVGEPRDDSAGSSSWVLYDHEERWVRFLRG